MSQSRSLEPTSDDYRAARQALDDRLREDRRRRLESTVEQLEILIDDHPAASFRLTTTDRCRIPLAADAELVEVASPQGDEKVLLAAFLLTDLEAEDPATETFEVAPGRRRILFRLHRARASEEPDAGRAELEIIYREA